MHRMMLVAALALGLGADLGARGFEDGGLRTDKDKELAEKEKAAREKAAREKAAREKKEGRPAKKKPKEGGVYTNTDLGAGSPSPAKPSTPAPPVAEPVAPPPTGTEYELADGIRRRTDPSEPSSSLPESTDEAGWRLQAETRRKALQTAERKVADVEARLAALMSDLSPTNVGDPFRLQTIEAEKAKARQDLEAAKAELAKAQTAWSEFEESARRKGVPPRWLEPPS